jgi:uncharacterized RDD family membrane protein YckC
MSTGFDRIWHDSKLQDHWIRRLVAFIIDSIIVAVAVVIFAAVVTIPLVLLAAATGLPWGVFNPLAFPFFIGLLSILYFSAMEFFYGGTFGKRIMNLKAVRTDGKRPSLDAIFVRNLSKIYWILILLDVIIGLATAGDAYQKFSDRMVGTTVISEGSTRSATAS